METSGGKSSDLAGSTVGAGTPSEPTSARRELHVQHLGRIDYASALALQESLLGEKVAGETADYLLLLEHDPVYTLGRGADAADLLGAPERLSTPVFRVGRGGGATFHGPGQVVGYPIVQLRGTRDVHRYVRELESWLLATCQALGVEAALRPGLTGIWVDEEKLASIGIGVRRGIAYHGIALNVCTDVRYFEEISPCRMPGLRVTTLERVLGHPLATQEVERTLAVCFRRVMGYP